MKPVEPKHDNGFIDPDSLLHLWMGDHDTPPPRRNWPSTPVLLVSSVLSVALLLGLLKYAIDVLLILLVVAAVGLVLHIVGIRPA